MNQYSPQAIRKDAQWRILRLMESIGLPPCVRLRQANTTDTTCRAILIAETLPIERMVLAAKADSLNRALLVAVFQTQSLTLIMDSSGLSLARQHRQREVMEFTRKLNGLGLLARGEYAPELVGDTSQLTPEEAAEVLLEKTHLEPINGNLGPYLRLLGQASLFGLDVTEEEFLHEPTSIRPVSSHVVPSIFNAPHDEQPSGFLA